MKNFRLFLLIFSLMLNCACQAISIEPDNIDTKLKKCISSDYSMSNMNSCVISGIESREMEIANYVFNIKTYLNSDAIKDFEVLHNTWLDLYNKDKNFIHKNIFHKIGTINTNITYGLLYEQVKARALLYKSYLNNLKN